MQQPPERLNLEYTTAYTKPAVCAMMRAIVEEANKYVYDSEEAKQAYIAKQKDKFTPVPAIVLGPFSSWMKYKPKLSESSFDETEMKVLEGRANVWSRDNSLVQSIATSGFHKNEANNHKIHHRILHTAERALADGRKALEKVWSAKHRWNHRKHRYRPSRPTDWTVKRCMTKLENDLQYKKRRLLSKEQLEIFDMYLGAMGA
jgi:hypothetical protein